MGAKLKTDQSTSGPRMTAMAQGQFAIVVESDQPSLVGQIAFRNYDKCICLNDGSYFAAPSSHTIRILKPGELIEVTA